MNKKTQELLTYEIFQKQDACYLSIPVNNLVNPKFLIKGKDLFIFLYNYSQCYVIKNLSKNIITSIIESKCFILENLNQEKPIKHLIRLFV